MKTVLKIVKLTFASITFFLLVSCQSNGINSTPSNSAANTPSCTKGSVQCCGKTRGTFLGDWFDYYERGLSYADCLMWQSAYNDLSTAVSKRSKDKRRVYTLGMHFITNYFPNRELGVVLYNQGKYAQAKKHLELSLVQFPSTKAEVYLNKTRIELQEVKDKEQTAPTFLLHSQTSDSQVQWSNKKGRALSLTVKDDTFINRIWINGEELIWQDVTQVGKTPVSIKRAKPEVHINTVLTTNKTEILIEAQDIFGNKSSKRMANPIDIIQPEIMITRIEENDFGEIEIEGVISDHQSGIKWFDIGEGKINTSAKNASTENSGKTIINNSLDFSFIAQGSSFEIRAQDNAGNELFLNRAVEFTQPLTIELQSSDVINTQENTWILSAWLESTHNINSYTINNQRVIGRGKRLHISHEIDLVEGMNTITLQVKDESGEMASKTVQVNRTIPHHLANSERLTLALFPFSCDQNTGAECENISQNHQLMDEQVRARKRFQLVERATLSDQLDSLKICELMVTDKCAWQAAQLVKTQSMFVGEMIVRKSPSSKSEEVYARIIDADNGSVLISFDAYLEGNNIEGKSIESKNGERKGEESINKQLYVKLHERFPLLSTQTLEIDGDEINANFDSQFQFWKNMPVKLFSDDKVCAQGLVVNQSSIQDSVQSSTIQIELNERCKGNGRKRLVTL